MAKNSKCSLKIDYLTLKSAQSPLKFLIFILSTRKIYFYLSLPIYLFKEEMVIFWLINESSNLKKPEMSLIFDSIFTYNALEIAHNFVIDAKREKMEVFEY